MISLIENASFHVNGRSFPVGYFAIDEQSNERFLSFEECEKLYRQLKLYDSLSIAGEKGSEGRIVLSIENNLLIKPTKLSVYLKYRPLLYQYGFQIDNLNLSEVVNDEGTIFEEGEIVLVNALVSSTSLHEGNRVKILAVAKSHESYQVAVVDEEDRVLSDRFILDGRSLTHIKTENAY